VSLPAPYYDDGACVIYHGDCLDLLPELSGIGAVLTDPPYSSGGAYRGDRTQRVVDKYVRNDTLAYRPDFAGDNRDQRSFLAWAALWLNAARRACVAGAPVACFTDWRQLPTMTDALQAGGWLWRGIAVWSKGYGRPAPGRFSNAAEYVCWGSAGPMPEREVYPPGIFECPVVSEREHVAEKPLAVMRWLCQIVPPGAMVLDPFMGSGTTLRAAKDAGLRAVGVEVDERYCELAARRMAQEVLPLRFEELPTAADTTEEKIA
jgi:site-specific DNA-methyltransferase (adenine-specific)